MALGMQASVSASLHSSMKGLSMCASTTPKCASPFLGSSKGLSATLKSATVARGSLVIRANTLEAGVGIFGNKAGMTQIFTEAGQVVPVTVISIKDGNYVTQVKTKDSDGYTAVQIGYHESKEKHISKPEIGHTAKAGTPPLRTLSEFRVASVDGYEAGQKLDVAAMFSEGDLVDIQGLSLGKGFQGGVVRHHYKRGLMTHGSKSHRQHGSIGSSATPSRVYPGTKLPGQMGNKIVKERKLSIVRVDAENSCILVKGSVPGKPGNLLRVTPAKIVGKNV